MSDREVNLEILLALAVARGRLDAPGRDRLLKDEEQAVAAAVLPVWSEVWWPSTGRRPRARRTCRRTRP